MDPNETLRQIREVIRCLREDETPGPYVAETLAELFGALDEWLCKGGFLPDVWNHKG